MPPSGPLVPTTLQDRDPQQTVTMPVSTQRTPGTPAPTVLGDKDPPQPPPCPPPPKGPSGPPYLPSGSQIPTSQWDRDPQRLPTLPPSAPQPPGPPCPPGSPQVPVEALCCHRRVPEVAALSQHHRAVGTAAPGRCQRHQWGHGDTDTPLPGTPTPGDPRSYRHGRAAGSRSSGGRGRCRGGRRAACPCWRWWPGAAPTATATAPGRSAGTAGTGTPPGVPWAGRCQREGGGGGGGGRKGQAAGLGDRGDNLVAKLPRRK